MKYKKQKKKSLIYLDVEDESVIYKWQLFAILCGFDVNNLEKSKIGFSEYFEIPLDTVESVLEQLIRLGTVVDCGKWSL